MKKIIVVIIALALVSCETDITDQFLNDSSKKMVLIGELVPNETPKLNLSKALSMLELDTVIGLNNAEIILEADGDRFVMHNTDFGFYELDDYLIEEGQTYTIYGSCETYDDVVVNIRVPEIPEVDINFSVNDTFLIDFSAKIRDPEQFADSYSFCISGWRQRTINRWINDSTMSMDTLNEYVDYSFSYLDSVPEYTRYYSTDVFSTIIYTNNSYWSRKTRKVYFSDRQFNGTEYSLKLRPELEDFYNDTIPSITVQVERFDRDFFSFIQSNASYYHRDNGNDLIDIDIPLTQPVHVYSNVEGGFGLVRARASYTETIDMSEWYNDEEFPK